MQCLTYQVLLLAFFGPCLETVPIIMKRAPLEVGYVSFTQTPIIHKPVIDAALINVKNESISVLHPKNIWVPGHISHHSYIPAHHIIVQPDNILLGKTVHAFIVKTHGTHDGISFTDDHFRHSYGGYGAGVGIGGYGAGHGYQVLL